MPDQPRADQPRADRPSADQPTAASVAEPAKDIRIGMQAKVTGQAYDGGENERVAL